MSVCKQVYRCIVCTSDFDINSDDGFTSYAVVAIALLRHDCRTYICSAAGSAVALVYLHAVSASQKVVEIIVRQQHFGQLAEILRLVVLEPQNLGGCEARNQCPVPLLGQMLSLLY